MLAVQTARASLGRPTEARAERVELLGRDRVSVLGARVAACADVVGIGRDTRGPLVLPRRVALDEARAEALADAEQVVEDELLAVDRRPGADADDGDLHARHDLLGERRRD